MRIVLESCDGCGKDELSKRLCNYYKLDEVHLLNSRDREYPLKYLEKHNLTNIVMNRCFISEYIYSQYYKRKTYVNKKEFETLLSLYRDINKWYFFILCCEPQELLNRVNKRGEDVEELEKLTAIDSMYRTIALSYNIPLIDTTFIPPDEIFGKVRKMIEK